MKHTLLTSTLVTIFATAAFGQSMQMPSAHTGITVSDAWARATAGSSTTGAAYVTITDNGSPDRLTGASTPVADMAHLHQTVNVNGVMKMRDVPGIALPSGKSVTLAPSGYHVMLMGLTHPLKEGDSFPLTLTFEHAPPVTVQVKVAGPGASEPMSHGMSSMPGMHMQGTKP